jgi:diphthamide synthase (EF-2-diphthine--ammonia ligase)
LHKEVRSKLLGRERDWRRKRHKGVGSKLQRRRVRNSQKSVGRKLHRVVGRKPQKGSGRTQSLKKNQPLKVLEEICRDVGEESRRKVLTESCGDVDKKKHRKVWEESCKDVGIERCGEGVRRNIERGLGRKLQLSFNVITSDVITYFSSII